MAVIIDVAVVNRGAKRRWFNKSYQQRIIKELEDSYNEELESDVLPDFLKISEKKSWKEIEQQAKAKTLTSDLIYKLLVEHQLKFDTSESIDKLFAFLRKYPAFATALASDLFPDKEFAPKMKKKIQLKITIQDDFIEQTTDARDYVIKALRNNFDFLEQFLDEFRSCTEQLAPSSLLDLAKNCEENERDTTKILKLLRSFPQLQKKLFSDDVKVEQFIWLIERSDEKELKSTINMTLGYVERHVNNIPDLSLYETISKTIGQQLISKQAALTKIVNKHHGAAKHLATLIQTDMEIDDKREALLNLECLLTKTSLPKLVNVQLEKLFDLLPEVNVVQASENKWHCETSDIKQFKALCRIIASFNFKKNELHDYIFNNYIKKNLPVPPNIAYLVLSNNNLWQQCYQQRWYHFIHKPEAFKMEELGLLKTELFELKITDKKFNLESCLQEASPKSEVIQPPLLAQDEVLEEESVLNNMQLDPAASPLPISSDLKTPPPASPVVDGSFCSAPSPSPLSTVLPDSEEPSPVPEIDRHSLVNQIRGLSKAADDLMDTMIKTQTYRVVNDSFGRRIPDDNSASALLQNSPSPIATNLSMQASPEPVSTEVSPPPLYSYIPGSPIHQGGRLQPQNLESRYVDEDTQGLTNG